MPRPSISSWLHRPSGMSPMSRRSFAGLVGAGAATALASCSSQDTSKDLDTLQVWGGVPPESGPQSVVDHFLEKHPDRKVTYTRFVNDDRGNLKVNTALQGGVDIDVFFTYDPSNLAMRSFSGMAADLGDLVRSTPELTPFLDTEVPKALIDGETITALATTKEPNFLLLNETLREEAGMDLPTSWAPRGVPRSGQGPDHRRPLRHLQAARPPPHRAGPERLVRGRRRLELRRPCVPAPLRPHLADDP